MEINIEVADVSPLTGAGLVALCYYAAKDARGEGLGEGQRRERRVLEGGEGVINPWELLGWVVAVCVSLVVISVALVLVVGLVKSLGRRPASGPKSEWIMKRGEPRP